MQIAFLSGLCYNKGNNSEKGDSVMSQKKPKNPGANRQQRSTYGRTPKLQHKTPKVLRILALTLFAFIVIGMVLVPLFASR